MHTDRVAAQWLLVLALVFTATVSSNGGDDSDGEETEENIDYVVEVLAVVDKAMLEKWMKSAGVGTKEKVIEEVNAMFFEVNAIYQSLRRYNLSVEIRLWDVLFPNESIVADYMNMSSNVVWQDVATKQFGAFLARNSHIKGWDHAMYITSHNLKGARITETGQAGVNRVCKGRQATSRVEGARNARSALTAAHEIGHSLGASHDSKNNPDCANGYVMDANGFTGSRKRWFFSPCTARRFRWTLRPKSCLLKTTSLPIVSSRLGELVNKGDMCKRFYGNRVYHKANSGDAMCNVLKCFTGKWIQKTNTPEGTACGNGKKCFQGYCV